MNGMMECAGMMVGMDAIRLLSAIALVLLIATLVKYLFFWRPKQ